jgi:hypothetical protein
MRDGNSSGGGGRGGGFGLLGGGGGGGQWGGLSADQLMSDIRRMGTSLITGVLCLYARRNGCQLEPSTLGPFTVYCCLAGEALTCWHAQKDIPKRTHTHACTHIHTRALQ